VAAGAGVPVAPGATEPVRDVDHAATIADTIGYPVMLKAAAGGGGMGMAPTADEQELRTAFERIQSFGARTFGSSDVLAAAVRLGESVGYRNAGTVECLVAGEEFIFLEMNTRLQVEHPVTEAVFGFDLVEQQLRIASGLAPSFDPATSYPAGQAIELRVNAEDPVRFLPGPGEITEWSEPTGDGVGWTPATGRAPRSRRSTIRCWPR
jgi:acetyl-CoA carboxylase biotin carboxylase subunit